MAYEDTFGTVLQNDKYFIEITEDNTFTIASADNRKYDLLMNPTNLKHSYKALRISVKGNAYREIVLIGDECTCAQDNCAILEDDVLTVLLNNHITQINIAALEIVGGYDFDVFGTTFAIYRMVDGYLIYGEIEIIKLDNSFNIVWKFSGKDIFVSVSGKNAFELTAESIKLYDFEDNFYELDFDGNMVNHEDKD